MAEPDDDTMLALAVLHGLDPVPDFYTDGPLWYTSGGAEGIDHPIHTANERATGLCGFRTRRELVLAYCRHHNLLDEVTA